MNYRGIVSAHIIAVLEGDDKENPLHEVKYIAVINTKGILTTVGTLKELTQEEEESCKRLACF